MDNNSKKSNKKPKNIFKKTQFNKLGIQLTNNQDKLYKQIRKNTLTMVSGPSGCSKTFSSCYSALGLLADNKVEKIVITKPLIESSKSMGHLPGQLSEKIYNYFKSYFSTFSKIVGKDTLQELSTNELIELETLNFMRGETYDNSIMLLDEAQNLTMKELMLWITRLGKNSKAVLMGDISQYDVKTKNSDFKEFIDEIINGIKGSYHFEFNRNDIVRNPFLIPVTDNYEKWKKNKEE